MHDAAIARLPAASAEAFRLVGSDAARDHRTVVVSWPAVPVEIIHAAGLRTVLAHGSATPTPLADAHLEPGVFPARLRQLIEAALAGRLANIVALVIPRTSDPDYKAYLYLREFMRQGIGGPYPELRLVDLLQSGGTAVAAHDRDQLHALYAGLAASGGREVSAAQLALGLRRANLARAAGRRLLALRARAPRLSGVDAMRLIGAFWNMPADRFATLANAALGHFGPRAPLRGARVLLAGAPVDTPALHAAIEARGALVTDEITPFGTDAVREDVLPAPDPLLALAMRYRATPGNARTPVQVAMRRFEAALGDVDAVVLSLPPDDATFGWDYPRMCESMARAGLPHAVVSADPAAPLDDAALQPVQAMLAALGDARHTLHG